MTVLPAQSERGLGVQLLEAEIMLGPGLLWVFNSDGEADTLPIG